MALTDEDKAILAFEHTRWRHEGLKEQAIRELFDITATRYYQRLNRLIGTEEAYVLDAPLVKRLRRLREQRQQARAARRLTA